MLESLRTEIEQAFQSKFPPRTDELVVRDGCDALDKLRAIDFYNKKSWEDVLRYLRTSPAGYSYLEEWSALSPKALAYYLRAYLEFLAEVLTGQNDSQEWYVSEIFHWLYQMVYMHKGSSLSPEQISVVVKIAEHFSVENNYYQRFPEVGEHIAHNVDMFVQELNKYRM